jgi:hypothetical protein
VYVEVEVVEVWVMNVRSERAAVAEECCLLTLSEEKGGHANFDCAIRGALSTLPLSKVKRATGVAVSSASVANLNTLLQGKSR